jgi:hypothetical protein
MHVTSVNVLRCAMCVLLLQSHGTGEDLPCNVTLLNSATSVHKVGKRILDYTASRHGRPFLVSAETTAIPIAAFVYEKES